MQTLAKFLASPQSLQLGEINATGESRIANLNFRWYQFASLELCTLSGIDLNLEIGPSRITRSAPYHYYIENTFDSECIE